MEGVRSSSMEGNGQWENGRVGWGKKSLLVDTPDYEGITTNLIKFADDRPSFKQQQLARDFAIETLNDGESSKNLRRIFCLHTTVDRTKTTGVIKIQ
jgi:hypothetical protein